MNCLCDGGEVAPVISREAISDEKEIDRQGVLGRGKVRGAPNCRCQCGLRSWNHDGTGALSQFDELNSVPNLSGEKGVGLLEDSPFLKKVEAGT